MSTIYNPPKSDCGSLTYLRDSLATTSNFTPIVLCGDFNLLSIDWGSGTPIPTVNSRDAVYMFDIVKDFNLQQLVLKLTRQQNILDLVLTIRANAVHNVEVSAGLPG